MKKISIMILIVGLLFLSACNNETKQKETIAKETSTLLDKGLELIAQTDTIAENEKFIKLQGFPEKVTTIISDIAKESYKEPTKVFVMNDVGNTIFEAMSLDKIISKDIKDFVKSQLVHTMSSHVNAKVDAYNLAAANVISFEDNFIFDGLTTDAVYVYLFDSKYSFIVTFVPDDENIVTAKATVAISEDLAKAKTTKDIEELFDDLGIEGLEVLDATKE